MIKDCKKSISNIAYSVLSIILLSSAAHASTLNIKTASDETTEVDIIIEPGVGTVLPNKKAIKKVVKPGKTEIVEVTKETFGTETFSVTGKVTMPSMNNKCELLSVDKNYNITFTNSKAGGIICKAEEI